MLKSGNPRPQLSKQPKTAAEKWKNRKVNILHIFAQNQQKVATTN
jgi:hypothetical protein